MKKKSWFSFLMIFVLIVNMLFVVNAQETIEDKTQKIDSVLLSKLDNMGSSETIAVSVWFTDIDSEDLRYNVEQAALKTRSSKSATQVSSEAVELLFYDVDNTDTIDEKSLNVLTEMYYDVTTEELQAATELERGCSCNVSGA